MEKFDSKEKALKYCFDRIKPKLLDPDTYNKFKLYRNRFHKGNLKDNAINTIFEYFGIEEVCEYRMNPKKSNLDKEDQ
jgi:hypothetical protein